MTGTARLSDPLPLPCGQTLRNRIMKSALSEALADPAHAPSTGLETLYRRWGTGGYGLVVTGNVMVDHRQLGEPGNVVVEDKQDLAALTRWAAACHDGGTPIWMQINHPGRQANALAGRRRPVAPSAIAAKVPGAVTPRALSGAEIEDLVDRFATTAAVAETAGFDGIQIHAAHGYLIAQFLSPLANQRTDDWGGDPTRRLRFLLEIVRRIRAGVGPGFAVGIKLNSADFQRGGFSETESREVVARLAKEGLDLIEISGGSYEAPAMMGTTRSASTQAREAYFLDYAQTVRHLARDVPLAVTGGFRSHTAMATAIADRTCDLIGLGRPTCTTPDAANALLQPGQTRLPVRTVRFGLRRTLGLVADLKTLDGALDLQWHTDQLHRLAGGAEPDPGRPRWKTLLAMLNRNGLAAFRSKHRQRG